MKSGLNHAVQVTVAALSIVLGLGAAVPAAAQCPGDCFDDGFSVVNGADLAMLLGRWGEVGPSPADVNADGLVDGRDLSVVLGGWGPCPPVITLILPNTGPTLGGTTVIISGNYFSSTATVTLGGLPATNVQVINATTITAVTPAAPPRQRRCGSGGWRPYRDHSERVHIQSGCARHRKGVGIQLRRPVQHPRRPRPLCRRRGGRETHHCAAH